MFLAPIVHKFQNWAKNFSVLLGLQQSAAGSKANSMAASFAARSMANFYV